MVWVMVWCVVVSRETCVSMLVAVIFVAAAEAPVASVTDPFTVAKFCACTAASENAAKAIKNGLGTLIAGHLIKAGFS